MSNMATHPFTEKNTKINIQHSAIGGQKNASLSLVKGKKNLAKPPVKSTVLTRKRKCSKHPLREIRIRSGCTLEALSQLTKMSPSYLSRLESGSRRLNADIIQRLSLALKCNPAELLPYNNFTGQSYTPVTVPAVLTAPVDLPIYTLKGQGADEAVLESVETEQWITRPTDFIGIKDAFACAVNDSQWSPRYMSGDRLLIHPTAPLKKGCSIIVTTKDDKTFLGTFQGINGQGETQEFKLETSFSKTVKTLSFKQKEIKAYRITGTLDAA